MDAPTPVGGSPASVPHKENFPIIRLNRGHELPSHAMPFLPFETVLETLEMCVANENLTMVTLNRFWVKFQLYFLDLHLEVKEKSR